MPSITSPPAPPCPAGAIPPLPARSPRVFRLDGPGLLSTDKKGRMVGKLVSVRLSHLNRLPLPQSGLLLPLN